MDPELRECRETLVRRHMQAENDLDFETVLQTFAHPRYELIGTERVFDGDAEVREYFRESRAAFPDQRNELIALHHADEAVIAEFTLRGTHEGPLRGIPATGKEFTCRCTAFFLFEEDRLLCERVYFDSATILGRQYDLRVTTADNVQEIMNPRVLRLGVRFNF